MPARRYTRRRKYTPRKRYTPRRRYYRRSYRRYRRGGKLGKKYSFVRYGATTVTYNVVDDATSVRQGWTFLLSNVSQYTEFTTLFDQYKINCIVLKATWHQSAESPGVSVNYPTPIMHYVVDYTDATAPLTVAELAQYQNYKQINLSRAGSWSVKIYPRVQKMVYTSAVATGYAPGKSWINTTDYGVPHYGFKFLVDGTAAGGGGTHALGQLQFQVKYYMQFKNVK